MTDAFTLFGIQCTGVDLAYWYVLLCMFALALHVPKAQR